MTLVLALIIVLQVLLSSNAEQKKFKHPYESDISFNIDIPKQKSNNINNSNQAVTFYLRLVKHLFRKQRFREDPNENNFFIANIPLRVNKEQYELLINSDIHGLNIEELDGLVEDVLMQSKDENFSIPHILYDYYREEIISSITTFSTPMMFCITALIAIILLSRFSLHLSKLTYSAIIIIAILAICVTSYSMMYHDCLNDLEVERMIQMSKESSLNNPCKHYHGEHTSYWTSMKAFLFGSSQDKCHEHMRAVFKPSKKYCDPLDVFARWSAKIQMSYIGSITGSFLELLTKITSSSNILTKIVVWVVCLFFFGYLLISIISVVIKSGFHGIFSALSTTLPSSAPSSSTETIDLLHTKMNEILSENKEMKRELRTIRECSVERSLKNSPPQVKRHKMSSIKETPVDQND